MNKMDYKIDAVDNLIVSHLSGSHSYGNATETSDVDVRGIFCADAINVRTPWFPVREINIGSMEDAKVYELTNYLKLYLDCNPNIIESLWVDNEDIIQNSNAYEVLRHYRKDLLCSKVAFTFTGYAASQLKRIKGHKKFINNPKDVDPPKQTDFVKLVQNFTDDKILAKGFHLKDYKDGRLVPFGNNLFGYYHKYSCPAAEGYETFSEDFTLNTVFDDESRVNYKQPCLMVKFNKEDYLRERDDWHNYWTWKKNRNEVRAKLEEEHTIDTKHASHLIRLMRMGEEILTTGEVIVRRPDAQELLDIRNGSMTYDEILKFAEEKDELIRGKLYSGTPLRKKPNVKLAAEVLMEVQDMYWNK